MDKAQERHDAAMVKLRARATEFVDTRRDWLRLEGTDVAAFTGSLLAELTAAYFDGQVDGGDNQREWHEAIGGCPR